MENELNASEFLFHDLVYFKEFENILSKITACYLKLRNDQKTISVNDENGIRDILVNNYINNPQIKKSIGLEYFVLPEVPESSSSGRTDIRIFSPNTFYHQDEYYVLECKRLDNKARRGNSGLNSKYIENGVQRFTSGFYSSYYKTNAMVGFVVESIDIHKNIEDLNYLLKENFKHVVTKAFIDSFEFHYSSSHTTGIGMALKLYHLMFDFS